MRFLTVLAFLLWIAAAFGSDSTSDKSKDLKEYFGIYQLGNDFIYIRTFDELGTNQLTYYDNHGNARALFPTGNGSFFAGPGLAVSSSRETEFQFIKDGVRIKKQSDQSFITAKKLTSYREEEVRFENGPVKLAGSLTLPAGAGPHPAVVFVHGSNIVTRDFFGPIAYHFAQNGIAALTYDKRGAGSSTGSMMDGDFHDLAEDALAGVRLLKTRKEVDPKRIGMLGISQGGWILPIAASRSPDVSYLILISAAGVTPGQQEVMRMRGQLREEGITNKEEIEQKLKAYGEQVAALRSSEVKQELKAEMEKLQKENKQEVLLNPGPGNPRYLLWYSGLIDFDPVPYLKKVKCPALVVYGELDYLVPPAENLPILENSFRAGGNTSVTIKTFPKANHALMECETGFNKEFPSLKRFSPGLFELLIDWVKKNNHKDATP